MVHQGFIASDPPDDLLSEAVVIEFDSAKTDLKTLIEIHLRTHSSMSNHVLRGKYRSAIYVCSQSQFSESEDALFKLGQAFEAPLITRILWLRKFTHSDERFQNYYAKDPSRPFCRTYIDPKLKLLLRDFKGYSKYTR